METFEQFVINLKKPPEKRMDFLEYYFKLMKDKDYLDRDVYTSVNMSRQTYSKIVNGDMKPSLKNAIKLAIGLKLNIEECKLLLKKLNYTLSLNSRFSLVIMYCIKYRIYDINKINKMLYDECEKTLDD